MKETKKMHQMLIVTERCLLRLKENFTTATKPVAFYVGKQHLLQFMDGDKVPQ